ncbi:MAG TPA: SDR family NAD(P)-dependent oxidoreductase [Thermoanaerobaculia bacterium]|nr:SDR family NAD(P)-dependent oxidoreductase [Thermoanaerobaculia bacterium]
MQKIFVTGGTGGLGTFVVDALSHDYECVVLGRDLATDVNGAHALVHLAGGFGTDWTKMLDANIAFAAKAFDALVPRLADGGRIVAISSYATISKPAGLGAYVASKAALNALVEVSAKQLASRRITVNALLPSSLDTPAMQDSKEPRVPLDRVAATIRFLLGDDAASITGGLIPLLP